MIILLKYCNNFPNHPKSGGSVAEGLVRVDLFVVDPDKDGLVALLDVENCVEDDENTFVVLCVVVGDVFVTVFDVLVTLSVVIDGVTDALEVVNFDISLGVIVVEDDKVALGVSLVEIIFAVVLKVIEVTSLAGPYKVVRSVSKSV